MIKLLDDRFKLVLSEFKDGTKRVSIEVVDCKYRDYLKDPDGCVFIGWRFESESEIVTLLYIVNWFRDNTSLKLYLDLYYVPYARMDRVEESSDVFTLKYFTNLLNSMRFEEVAVLDPHSRVSPALIDRVRVVEPVSQLRSVLKDIASKGQLTILFPDRGAYERYLSPKLQEVFKEFSITQFLYGEKRRDWKTSNIQNFYINTKGIKELGNVLIIDDIITTGGTIEKCIQAVEDLDDFNSRLIYVYSTFLEKAFLDSDKFNWIYSQCEGIFTTDALLTDGDKVSTVLPKLNIVEIDEYSF